MRPRLHREWLLLLAGAAALFALPAPADEAVLRDGRRIAGTLRLVQRRWQFLPAGKSEPISVASLSQVRLEAASVAPLRAGSVHRVTLRDGQAVTAALLDLDNKTLALRTAWTDRLVLPRAAVASITQLRGWGLVFLDDFEGGLSAWKVEGKPEFGGPKSGRKALLLAPGQAMEHTLREPIEEGRAGVNFHDGRDTSGATWVVDAEFRTPTGPRVVRTVVAGDATHYEAKVPDRKGLASRLLRSEGWHRLTVQVSQSSLRVVVDEAVLWYSLEQGPGGPLVRWRMACRKTDGSPSRGRVAFDEFAVYRAVDELRRPPAEPDQDEVWLAGGDQLFGRVSRADARSLTIEGRFGRRTLSWTTVRGITLRQGPQPPQADKSECVRLWIGNGHSQLDELDAVVLSLDGRRCRLRHALFGELELERGRITRILWDLP